MKSNKIKKFTELSTDIEDSCLEIGIEKIKNGEYEIESIIDVITDPEKLQESNVINLGSELGKDIKRGDTLYIVALLRKSGTTSFSSPATQGIVKVRIVEIYNGLSYLNKIMK